MTIDQFDLQPLEGQASAHEVVLLILESVHHKSSEPAVVRICTHLAHDGVLPSWPESRSEGSQYNGWDMPVRSSTPETNAP